CPPACFRPPTSVPSKRTGHRSVTVAGGASSSTARRGVNGRTARVRRTTSCKEKLVGSGSTPMADPFATADDAVSALELVLEHARGYLADPRCPVRRADSDDAARSFP